MRAWRTGVRAWLPTKRCEFDPHCPHQTDLRLAAGCRTLNARIVVRIRLVLDHFPSRRAECRDTYPALYLTEKVRVIDGEDLRRDPLVVRNATLASVLARAAPGLRLNEHIEHDGPIVFAHACRMGLEGIVSKRKASPYRSGRTADWIKSKNPDAPAVKREAEQEWDRWPSKKARPSSRC